MSYGYFYSKFNVYNRCNTVGNLRKGREKIIFTVVFRNTGIFILGFFFFFFTIEYWFTDTQAPCVILF